MTSSLRVALLHNYRDDQQPSMRLYAERLGNALIRRGTDVIRVRPPGIVPDAWRARSALWTKLDAYVGRFVVYPRLVQHLNADVIHVIDHGQGYLLASIDAHRTVVTCHDVILLALASGRIGSAPVPPVALQLLRISLEFVKRAAAVVAVSDQTKRDLVSFVGVDPDQVTVIHSGLNQPFAPNPERGAAFRHRLDLGAGLLMLQIGRGFYKNIIGALRVLHRLRKDGLAVQLVRTGRVLAGEERRLAERLDLVDHIQELGGVPDADIPALYNAVDLLLFPSLYEGWGWPPLEAMASGTPVVCSSAGSLPEVVDTAALTAEPEDVETLAWHAAGALTDQTLRARLVERGLARAAQFRWEKTAAETSAVYARVAERAS